MAYCTSADVQIAVGGAAKLAAVSDQANGGVIDAAVVAAAIAEADALINSYASKRFAVPIAPAPPTFVALSARYSARILRRNRSMQLVADLEEEKADRAWLEDLAAGKVLPGVEPLPAKGSIVVDQVGDRESVRTTTREKTKGGLW